MQLTRGIGLALAAGLTAEPVLAIGVDGQTATHVFQFFSDADDVHVMSNYGTYDLMLENQTAVKFKMNREIVIIPAVDDPAGSQEAVDAITTASRPIRSEGDAYEDFRKHRNEFQLGLNRSGVDVGYYVSSESDYFAQQVSSSVNRGFYDDNLNVSLGASYGWDDVKPLNDFDTTGAPGYRNTTHANAVITQILDPKTVVRMGVEMNRVRGLQHNPYRNVYVAGSNVAELHPEARDRRDVFMRLNRYLTNRSSLKFDYKYYFDDWGIGSHTAGLRLSQYVTDQIVVRYRYRYYDQGAADFYRDEYVAAGGVDGYQTGDYRMGEFTAHLFGTRLDWALSELFAHSSWMSRFRLTLNYERYFNSNNFSANIFESGLSLEF